MDKITNLIDQLLDLPKMVNEKLPSNNFNAMMDSSEGSIAGWTGTFYKYGAFVVLVGALYAVITGGIEGMGAAEGIGKAGAVLGMLVMIYAAFPITQVIRSAGDSLGSSKSGIVDFVFKDVVVANITVLGHVSIAGLIGGTLAFVAFLIFPSNNIAWDSLGSSNNIIRSNNFKLGVLMTGAYGIMQWTTTSTMRIFIFSSTAEFSTGIIGLGVIITISSTIGYVIKNIMDPKSSLMHDENKEIIKNQMAIRNWKYGNAISLASLIVMLYGIFYSTTLIFIGYIIFKGVATGVLRPIETHLAGNLLIGEGNSVGLRERMKFRAKVLALVLLVYHPTLIFVAIICALLSFTIVYSPSLRQQSYSQEQ